MNPNESLTDEQLMKAYQNGAGDAFDVLFKRHSARVYGFLMNQLRDRAQADDVFQATFLKLHRSRRHYDPVFPFAPWLFTVCKSVLTDHRRKMSRVRERLDQDLVSSAVDDRQTVEPRPEISLEGLSDRERTAIQLRYVEDLKFEEIAARLKTSSSNVRQIISRSIKTLKLISQRKED